MRVRIVVDMNLSAEWVPVLSAEGWPTLHWSAVGDPRSADIVNMEWARTNAHAVFTHDLDFTAALALTHATGPSLIQVRGALVLPEQIGPSVIAAVRQYGPDLRTGALVTIDTRRSRVRVLPL